MGKQMSLASERIGNKPTEMNGSNVILIHPQGVKCFLLFRNSLIICGCCDLIKIIPIKYMKEFHMIKSVYTEGVYMLCEINKELFAAIDKKNTLHIWNVSNINYKIIQHICDIHIINSEQQIKCMCMLDDNVHLMISNTNNELLIFDIQTFQIINKICFDQEINKIFNLKDNHILILNEEGVLDLWKYSNENILIKTNEFIQINKSYNIKNVFKISNNEVVIWDNVLNVLIIMSIEDMMLSRNGKEFNLQQTYRFIEHMNSWIFIGKKENSYEIIVLEDLICENLFKHVNEICYCSFIIYGENKGILINRKEGTLCKMK